MSIADHNVTYNHIADVLQAMRREGKEEFGRDETLDTFKKMFPEVVDLLAERKRKSPSKHSIEDHLMGRIWDYYRLREQDKVAGPAIERLGKSRYRFQSVCGRTSTRM